MKFDELMSKILEIMPNATLDEDNYGQIIVYTDLEETPNGQLRKFVEPPDDDETEEDDIGIHFFAGLSMMDDCSLCGRRYEHSCHGYMDTLWRRGLASGAHPEGSDMGDD